MINPNENPGIGFNSNINIAASRKGYGITGHKDMLNKTRNFLDALFYDDCVWLRMYFNIHYERVC